MILRKGVDFDFDFDLKFIHAFTALLQFLNTVISPLWHQHNSFWASEILLVFLWCSRNSLPSCLLPLRRTQEYRLGNALSFFGTMLEGPPCPLPASNIFMEINPCCPSPGQTEISVLKTPLISQWWEHMLLVWCLVVPSERKTNPVFTEQWFVLQIKWLKELVLPWLQECRQSH